MIWVDYRQGSAELLEPLRKAGIRAEETTLNAADFAFTGNGPDGDVEVGIERKVLRDLVDSLKTGRLQGMQTESGNGGQIGRLVETYDYAWLLVEGAWTVDKQGRLCQRRHHNTLRPVGGSEDMLVKRLMSLELLGGLRVKQTANARETVRWLVSLYRWFTDKDWHQHGTLNAVSRPQQGIQANRLSRFQEMLLPLPGVGFAVARAIEQLLSGTDKLGQLRSLSISTLAELPIETPAGPRMLGRSKAEKIVIAIRSL